MTSFGRLSVIFLRICGVQRRPKFLHFGLSCDLCRERHKKGVWLCCLILSILSSSTCASAAPPDSVTKVMQQWLKDLNARLEKSDALLYAPALNDIPENCRNLSLICYVDELEVISIEEDLTDALTTIHHFKKMLPPQVSSGSCPPCEAQTLEPATKFLRKLMELLQYMVSKETMARTLM